MTTSVDNVYRKEVTVETLPDPKDTLTFALTWLYQVRRGGYHEKSVRWIKDDSGNEIIHTYFVYMEKDCSYKICEYGKNDAEIEEAKKAKGAFQVIFNVKVVEPKPKIIEVTQKVLQNLTI